MLKLQLALDFMPLEESLKIAQKVEEYVDWIEAGTTILLNEGNKFIRELKKRFPSKPIVADLKIIAGEKFIAESAIKAGADIVVVQACATDSVIKRTIEVAKKYNKEVMVDFMGVWKGTLKRAKEIEKLGPDYISLHSEGDPTDRKFLEDLENVSKTTKTSLVFVGGINLKNIDKLLKFKPSVIVVGGAITRAEDPEQAAKALKEKMKATEQ